jgi:anti-sigma factor RsiW
MSGQPGAATTEELHAYVDGALEAADRARVEAHLARHPEDAAAVRDYQRQNEALRALAASLDGAAAWPARRGALGALARDAVGARYRGRAFARARGAVDALARGGLGAVARGGAVRALPWAAAVAGLLALGAAGGWWVRGASDRPELYQLAATAYRVYTVQQRHPVEVWANEREHLEQWLGNVLGTPFVAPDLAQQGYTLVGGRLLTMEQGAAALLIYQDPERRRLALFVCTKAAWGAGGKAYYEGVGPLGTFTWPKGPLWYSLAGTLDAPTLKTMAQRVNEQVAGAAGAEAWPGPLAQRR